MDANESARWCADSKKLVAVTKRNMYALKTKMREFMHLLEVSGLRASLDEELFMRVHNLSGWIKYCTRC